MDYLHIGLIKKQHYTHSICCSFHNPHELLASNEVIISKYSFPLQEATPKELQVIAEFAEGIGQAQTLLQLAEQCTALGTSHAIEYLKPPKYYRFIDGYYEMGKFIPDINLEAKESKEFCNYCVQADLSNEISNVIRLFFNTGKVLVEKAPMKEIIRYWEN